MRNFVTNDISESSQNNEKKTTAKSEAEKAVDGIIRKYTLESLWPSEKDNYTSSLFHRMGSEIADLFGRELSDVSLKDLDRAQRNLSKICKPLGIRDLKFGKAARLKKTYDDNSWIFDLLSHTYAFGMAFSGNFSPLVRKFGVRMSGAPLARATGVWLTGQVLKDLFFDPDKDIKFKKPLAFEPLFDSFTLDHLRELSQHMSLNAAISWDEKKLRDAILNNLKSSYHNYVVGKLSEMPPYKSILLNLCSELEIPDFDATDDIETLEERIIKRVFAECIDKLSEQEIAKLKKTVRVHMKDNYWSGARRPIMMLSGLAAGRMSGVGLYVAASSGLAAIGAKGAVGTGAALTGYTAMSTAMSSIFGPVGIGVAGAAAFFQLTKPRPLKALPFVVFMAVMRGRLRMESEKKISIFRKIYLFFKRVFI